MKFHVDALHTLKLCSGQKRDGQTDGMTGGRTDEWITKCRPSGV